MATSYNAIQTQKIYHHFTDGAIEDTSITDSVQFNANWEYKVVIKQSELRTKDWRLSGDRFIVP